MILEILCRNRSLYQIPLILIAYMAGAIVELDWILLILLETREAIVFKNAVVPNRRLVLHTISKRS